MRTFALTGTFSDCLILEGIFEGCRFSPGWENARSFASCSEISLHRAKNAECAGEPLHVDGFSVGDLMLYVGMAVGAAMNGCLSVLNASARLQARRVTSEGRALLLIEAGSSNVRP
jgi:hypothetical protein